MYKLVGYDGLKAAYDAALKVDLLVRAIRLGSVNDVEQ